VAFHQDALGLADDVTVAERGMQLVSTLGVGERQRGQGGQQGGDLLMVIIKG
jgi:hypothetical protein